MFLYTDFSLPFFRWLIPSILNRIESFALENDLDPKLASVRVSELILQAKDIVLLLDCVENDLSNIQAHCLIKLIPSNDKISAYVEQIKVDSGHDEKFVRDCIQYVEVELKKLYPALSEIVMSTREQKYRAFKKKYEFSVGKVLMSRPIKEV